MSVLIRAGILALGAVLLIPSGSARGEAAPQETLLLVVEAPSAKETITVLRDGDAQEEDFETYLTQVVLSEMPADFATEALKAQAVAARTFARRQMAGGKHADADVCSQSACCQACLSVDALQERVKHRRPAETPEMFQRIFQGSMPALASGAITKRNLFYSSYIATYIERDIRQLSGTIDAVEFLRFLTAVACRAGQMVNYADIGNDMDSMRSEKVQEWLGLLEKSDIIFYLHPYSNNLLKRTVTKPKLYFYDTGLVAYLTKWTSAETLEAGAMNGAILENYTVAEIVKTYLNAGEEPNLFYYRDNDAKEIDIVMEADGELHPMEIKKTANPGTQLARPFKLLDKGAVKRGKGAILCMKDQLSALDSQNLIVPIWAI